MSFFLEKTTLLSYSTYYYEGGWNETMSKRFIRSCTLLSFAHLHPIYLCTLYYIHNATSDLPEVLGTISLI